MRVFLLAFLAELERRIPPPPYCHHTLCRAQYGSNAAGWEEKLAIQVNDGGKFYAFFLDEIDFERDPLELAESVAELHRTEPSFMLQQGVAAGQFVSDENVPLTEGKQS